MPLKNGYMFLPPRGHRVVPRELAKLVKYQRLAYEPAKPANIKGNSVVINWGNCYIKRCIIANGAMRLLNRPEAVQDAANKLRTFDKLEAVGIPIPQFTINGEQAKKWWEQGNVVYTRTLLTGHSGNGIIVQIPKQVDQESEWIDEPKARVHTRRFTGKFEFRVHVFDGELIHVQQKRKRRDVERPKGFYVKNVENGYVFTINDVDLPEKIGEACIKAVKAVGLDFGAVDVGYAPTKDEFCVFEINTRPMLTGTTLLRYKDALEQLID